MMIHKTFPIILLCSILVGACANVKDVNNVKSSQMLSNRPQSESKDNDPVLLQQTQHICIIPNKFAELVKDFDETIVASWVLRGQLPLEPSGTGFLAANLKTGTVTVAYTTELVNVKTGAAHRRICIAFIGINYSGKIKERRGIKTDVRNILEPDL